jgi:hypothetical protein
MPNIFEDAADEVYRLFTADVERRKIAVPA